MGGYGFPVFGGGWLNGIWVAMGVVLLVVLLVRLISGRRNLKRGNGPTDQNDSGRQIIDERYARGELTMEEYRSGRER